MTAEYRLDTLTIFNGRKACSDHGCSREPPQRVWHGKLMIVHSQQAAFAGAIYYSGIEDARYPVWAKY